MYSWKESASFHSGAMNIEMPFQNGRKLFHHRRSALASGLRWMWWCSFLTVVESWMRRRRNRRPAGTTLAAKDSFPMRDRSSLLVALRLPSHDLIRDEISCSFSGGNLSCCREESRTMPRKVMQVAGPSHFSVATGIPIASHTWSMVDMDSWQVGWSGGPTRRKSSR